MLLSTAGWLGDRDLSGVVTGDVQLHTLHFNRDAILTSLPHSIYHIYSSSSSSLPSFKGNLTTSCYALKITMNQKASFVRPEYNIEKR